MIKQNKNSIIPILVCLMFFFHKPSPMKQALIKVLNSKRDTKNVFIFK